MSAISVESEASEINIQSGPKSKPSSFLLYLHQILTDFDTFTPTISSKFKQES